MNNPGRLQYFPTIYLNSENDAAVFLGILWKWAQL